MNAFSSSFSLAGLFQRAVSALGGTQPAWIAQLSGVLTGSGLNLGLPVSLAVNHLLVRHPVAQTKVAQFEGQVLAIHVGPARLTFAVQGDGLVKAVSNGTVVDTTISMDLTAVPVVMADPTLAMSKASIEGSMELAQCVGYLIKTLRWDPEDDLARIVGDEPAVHLMNLGRALRKLGKEQLSRTSETVREYVVYEQSMVVEQQAFDGFVADVKTLRDDVARLEKRFKALDRVTSTPKQSDSQPGDLA